MGSQDVNDEHSVGVDVVKKVIRQVIAGVGHIEPVQAVCASGMLVPRLRHQASVLEPMLEDFIRGLKVVNGEVRCTILGTDKVVPLPGSKPSPASEVAALYKPG